KTLCIDTLSTKRQKPLKIQAQYFSFKGVTQFQTKEQTGIQLAKYFLGRARSGQTADHDPRLRRQAEHGPPKYNVIYVIDSSSSISNVDFRLALKAIGYLTLKARHDTKYAAVMFSTDAEVISTFTTPKAILRRLKSVQRERGGTNIYDALKACSELFNNPSSGFNPEALNRILIITDGLANMKQSKTLTEALQLKLNNTEIFVVAVGHYLYGLTEISFLATSQESHVFRVKTMKGLFDVTKWIPYDFNGYINGYNRKNHQNDVDNTKDI
ncbi:hypothetical protein QZH41_011306, partial [Actinostola sp. cb2023]